MAQIPVAAHLTALLDERSLIRISGSEAAHFLNNTITAESNALAQMCFSPAALLSPQGKILFDFLIARAPPAEEAQGQEGFLIDIAADLAENFAKRLSLYKLRADVRIAPPQAVYIGIFTAAEPLAAPAEDADALFTARDMRFPPAAPVYRAYYPQSGDRPQPASAAAAAENWDRLRIAFCLPESGRDFTLGDSFPHDVNYDCIGAVARQKGCYIGQEVVSRMQHKAVIRKRLLRVEAAQDLPPQGTEILADGKVIGRLGTVCGAQGLAVIRFDKIMTEDGAKQMGAQANGVDLHFTPPPYLPQLFAAKRAE